jgi:hypothetical protein
LQILPNDQTRSCNQKKKGKKKVKHKSASPKSLTTIKIPRDNATSCFPSRSGSKKQGEEKEEEEEPRKIKRRTKTNLN